MNKQKGSAALYVMLMLVLILAGSFYTATRDSNKTLVQDLEFLFPRKSPVQTKPQNVNNVQPPKATTTLQQSSTTIKTTQ